MLHKQHLTLSIDEHAGSQRSITASPQPPSPSSYMSSAMMTGVLSGSATSGGDPNYMPPLNMLDGGMGSSGEGDDGGDADGSGGDGRLDSGVESHFGRAKKNNSKRKTAPRTSRACLACRRQKMRCEGADDPPCRRCVANGECVEQMRSKPARASEACADNAESVLTGRNPTGVDCMFERRSDYLLK